MLRKFSAEDAAVAGPNAQVPQWSMKMPGIGSKAIVRIVFPLIWSIEVLTRVYP